MSLKRVYFEDTYHYAVVKARGKDRWKLGDKQIPDFH